MKLDDGLSDWTFEYLDLQRKKLYSLINEMGGVYENRNKRRAISTSKIDMISFFSTPYIKDEVLIPGVLLIGSFNSPGFATLFTIDSKGKLACGAINFHNNYCTGGAVYTTRIPGIFFSTKDSLKKDTYSQFRISPGKALEKMYGNSLPVEWLETEEVVGAYNLFSIPIVPKEYGDWVRLDNINQLAKAKAQKEMPLK